MVLVFIAWSTDQICICSEKALITILCTLWESTTGNCDALASGSVFCRNHVKCWLCSIIWQITRTVPVQTFEIICISRNTLQSECYFTVVQMESEMHFEAVCDEVGNQINKWNGEWTAHSVAHQELEENFPVAYSTKQHPTTLHSNCVVFLLCTLHPVVHCMFPFILLDQIHMYWGTPLIIPT